MTPETNIHTQASDASVKSNSVDLANPTQLSQEDLERLQAAQDAVAAGKGSAADKRLVVNLSIRLGDPFDF